MRATVQRLRSFAPKLLQMNDHVGGILDQRLVVGDKQHCLAGLLYQCFQPLQRFDVNIIEGSSKRSTVGFQAKALRSAL